MKFGPIETAEGLGKVLGHNIANHDGKRILRKGKIITGEDIELLQTLGRTSIYVAELERDDISEDEAAERIAIAATGNNLRLSSPATGRVNIFSTKTGVLRVNLAGLNRINSFQGITLATLETNSMVVAGKMAATVKILPYALPSGSITSAEELTTLVSPILQVDGVLLKRVGLILSGSSSVEERVVNSFNNSLQRRLNLLEADIVDIRYVPLEDEAGERELSLKIREQIQKGCQILILAGETAIMDMEDIAPRAVVRAGGEVICYGAPVDPGNLLMLAMVDDTPILGAPGCARSPKANIVDLVLPRLLAGERLAQADIVQFGHGGLLEDVPERPLPRSRIT
jgi:molybdenum cofactor cytidylyltransferase